MVWLLRDSLWPLCIISKVLCTHTFSRKELRTSFLGNLLAASMAIAYSVFHLDAAQRRAVGNEENVNTVTAIIDSYNRYCGFCGFAINIVTSIVVQKKIICTIQLLERVDFVLEQNYSLRVDNTTWIIRVTLQWFILIGLYTLIEFCNCLMYIKDAAPLVDSFFKCYIMCLVPNYVTGTIEIQFMAYLQLIRNRLKLLNTILTEFRPMKRTQLVIVNIGLVDPKRLLDGIGAYAIKGKSKLQFPACDMTTSNSQNQKPWYERMLDILNWVVTLLVKPKISIEAFRGCDANLFSDAENIAKLHEAYSKLEQSAILINSSYSMQLIVILIIKFTTLTSLLYVCCMMIIKILSTNILTEDETDQLFSSSGWIGLFGMEIFALCYACSTTKTEVKRIAWNLHRYAMECGSVRCKMKMKTFSIQLLHQRIDFSPFGLFKLDLSFTYALVGAICTYLIILIQFDLAQTPSKFGNNSTIMDRNDSLHH